MKIKIQIGLISFEVDASFDEFLKLLELLHKTFPAAKVSVISTYQTCYVCKHQGDTKYCDAHALDYGERTCTGFESYV